MSMLVGFEVFTAASMKMAVFWVVAPCNLVDVYRRFRGIRPDDGGSTSETLVNFYDNTRRYNPEDSHLLVDVGLLRNNAVWTSW
jgi:hypothetical protein